VRDGLSLLDQAIAQADGAITEAAVINMLGLRGSCAGVRPAGCGDGGQPRQALQVTELPTSAAPIWEPCSRICWS